MSSDQATGQITGLFDILVHYIVSIRVVLPVPNVENQSKAKRMGLQDC